MTCLILAGASGGEGKLRYNYAKILQVITESEKFSSQCARQVGVFKPTNTSGNSPPISDVPSILHKNSLKPPNLSAAFRRAYGICAAREGESYGICTRDLGFAASRPYVEEETVIARTNLGGGEVKPHVQVGKGRKLRRTSFVSMT